MSNVTLKGWPTYLEYVCPEHPEMGWQMDLDYSDHRATLHSLGQYTGRCRTAPLPRPGHTMPQAIGWGSVVAAFRGYRSVVV